MNERLRRPGAPSRELDAFDTQEVDWDRLEAAAPTGTQRDFLHGLRVPGTLLPSQRETAWPDAYDLEILSHAVDLSDPRAPR
jgi:hypothetical protein